MRNAHQIRLQVDRVLSPARLKIAHGVTADPAVEKLQSSCRQINSQPRANQIHITVPQIVIPIFLIAPPFHVRDRIPLEEQSATFW